VTDTRAVHPDTRSVRTRRPAAAVITEPADAGAEPLCELDHASRLLGGASDVVLLAHVNPDADALGSALALGLGLERRGTPVVVSFAEPDQVPESLRALPGRHLLVRPDQLPARPDLLVSLDVGSAQRLGSLARLLRTARQSLVIDHHPSNTRFGDHHLIDPTAEATAVLVARLLDRLRITIDRQIAENLYAGLATDTGHFRHADSDTHRLAARLIDAGVRPAELLAPISDSHPFSWLGMLSTVLSGAVLEPAAVRGQGLVYAVIDSPTSAGLRPEELDSVIDILRTAQQAAVAAVLKQTHPGAWQVSLRSGASVDISAVATALGGGGHVRAAGFAHHGTSAQAVDALIGALEG